MTRRRKLTRKNANGRITPWLLEKLASGYEYSFLAGEVPSEDLKDAWLENRDWLLERHIQTFPGTRPWAWWRFDAPESRKNVTVGEEWRDFFGLPYEIDFQQEPAIFETEAEYLKRVDLLEKGEIPGRYATNLFLCSDQFSPKVTEFTAADRVAIERGCYFDRREAYRVWRFLTRYIKLSHGDWAGKPFVPQAWQWHNILGPMFGWWTSDGLRRFRRSFIFIPKKNGKSTLCSALVLYFLNDGEGSAEVYSVATAVDQAKIIYRETMKMVRKSPDLSSASRIIDSRKIIEQGDCFYRALSGDSASSEGLNIHALIVDELHAWNTPTLTELWNSLKYGGAARKQPMQVVITTAGEADEDALWYEEYAQAKGVVNGTDTDIHLLPFIAEAGEDDPWDEPATWAKVPDGDVIHVRGLSTEGLLGLSVIDLASETLRKTKSREVFAQKFYKNGAMPSGVLECDNDKPLSDESYKRLQKTFIESHTGLTNAGKPMILEGGMKYHALTMTLKDTEFIEQEEFDLLTIANWFGLTPDQLGYPKGSQSYSSLEIMTQRHLDNAINPWLTRIEQAYTQKLLSREEKQGGVFVEFDRAAAIRMDSETKSRSISLNVQAGVLSTNEGREQLGLPPRTDGLGDFYIMPLNMSFADQRKDLAAAQIEKMRIGINPHEVKNSETNIPPKEEDRSMTNVIDDYRNRANRYISNTIKRVSKSPERLQEWLESGWRDTRDAVQEEFQPLEKAGLLDAAESATKLIEPYLSEWRTKNEA